MTHTVNSRLGRLSGFLAGAAVALGLASSARAVVLAYEGFDYAASSPLISAGTGLNGGTGWGGGWDEAQGTNLSTLVQAGSLGYTDSLGNALVTTGGKLLNSGETGISQPGRNLAVRRDSPTTGATVSTWISFVGQRVGTLNPDGTFAGTYRRGANLALFDYNPVDGVAAAQPEKFNFGESSNYQYPLAAGGYEDRWQARHAGIAGGVTVPQPYAPNPTGAPTGTATTAQVRDAFSEAKFANLGFALMRIDHVVGDSNDTDNGGNDNVYIWMNPVLNSVPSDASASIKFVSTDVVAAANALATPIAAYLGAPTTPNSRSGGEMSFDRFRLFAGNDNGNPFAQWLFDELRVGTTFADVTPFTPSVVGLPGDYNNNHKVDAADYTTWRDNLGAPTEASLNGNGDGANGVDANDYTRWKTHFGESNGAGAGGASASGVPEPTAMLLALLGLLGLSATRHRTICPN